MTPPGVGWRCSNRLMSGMALAVVAADDRLTDPGGGAVRPRMPSGPTRCDPTLDATLLALALTTLTFDSQVTEHAMLDTAVVLKRARVVQRGSGYGDDARGMEAATTPGAGKSSGSPAKTEVAVHARRLTEGRPKPGGTCAAHGASWDADLEPHPLAPTARSGLVLAVESPPSPLRHRAAAGVGWARPTAVLRLGGARILVLRCPDAPPASS
jgi:hypothetical protein